MVLSISERGFGENSYTTKHSEDQVSLKSPALRRGFVCQGVTVDHFLRAVLGLWDPRVWGGEPCLEGLGLSTFGGCSAFTEGRHV